MEIHFRAPDTVMTGHVDELELQAGVVLALPRA